MSRIGGDEFLIVSETVDSVQLAGLLEKSRKEFRRIGDESGEFEKSFFHFSFGCIDMDYDKYNVAQVVQIADGLMYENKQEYYKKQNIKR